MESKVHILAFYLSPAAARMMNDQHIYGPVGPSIYVTVFLVG